VGQFSGLLYLLCDEYANRLDVGCCEVSLNFFQQTMQITDQTPAGDCFWYPFTRHLAVRDDLSEKPLASVSSCCLFFAAQLVAEVTWNHHGGPVPQGVLDKARMPVSLQYPSIPTGPDQSPKMNAVVWWSHAEQPDGIFERSLQGSWELDAWSLDVDKLVVRSAHS